MPPPVLIRALLCLFHGCTGKFASANGTASCAECDLGRFAAVAGASSCRECAAGQYQNATGQSACLLCSAGETIAHCHSQTAVFCWLRSNPTGSRLIRVSLLFLHCDCAGSANPNTGSASAAACQLCVPGRFAAAMGMSVCSECAAGGFAAIAGQSACTLCAAGPYGNAGSHTHTRHQWKVRRSTSTELTFQPAPLCTVPASALCRPLLHQAPTARSRAGPTRSAAAIGHSYIAHVGIWPVLLQLSLPQLDSRSFIHLLSVCVFLLLF